MLPGVAVAAVAVGVAWAVHWMLPVIPTLTVAFALGLIFGQFPVARHPRLAPGFAFSARRLLRLGVVLLGLKVSIADVLGLGWLVFVLVVALVALSFGATYLVFRLSGADRARSVLVAAGFSICGVSAVGATAAVLPAARPGTDADDPQRLPIALVTLYGTAAIAVLPLVGGALGLDPIHFGAWAGASVHDVGQVVATAQTAGAAALAVAVTVKLVRVAMLAPMVAVIGAVARRRTPVDGERRPPLLPLFVAGFVLVAVIGNLIPWDQWGIEWILTAADLVQTVLFGLALFSIGAGIRLRTLFTSDARSLLAGAVAWAIIAAAALGMVLVAVH